ncbi:MAG: NAD(P)H-dependent oxidoreductase [Candidatus ainarchaeum sp.]|nr:NAD(P)H-dependent oxidoreductase [Candidatus ainarchaeum sp.]
MKVLIICGSLRVNSLTRKLTDIAFDYAKTKYGNEHEITYLDLGKTPMEHFSGYASEVQYKKETLEVVNLVESSDVLLIGSPIYDAVFSSGIKNLFEFLDYKAPRRRAAGFMIKSASPGSFQLVRSQLVAMMHYFSIVCNPRAVFASDADFENRSLKNEEVKKRIERLVDETIAMMK